MRHNNENVLGEEQPLLLNESLTTQGYCTIEKESVSNNESKKDIRQDRGLLPRIIWLIAGVVTLTCLSRHPQPLLGGLWQIKNHNNADLPTGTVSPSLAPFTFSPLPLGSIKPLGWLYSQLDLMAAGLAGTQHTFYRFVANSSWLGGSSEYSPLNEGFPYWLNGIVPLAYALDDQRLKRAIQESVGYVIEHQWSDGWLGPESAHTGQRNLWARYPLLSGLTQLLEADESYTLTVLPAMRRFVECMYGMLKHNGTGMMMQPGDMLSEQDHGWARTRVADLMVSLQWMYEHDEHGGQGGKLLNSMRLLRKYALDWSDWYDEEHYISGDVNHANASYVDEWFPFEHGVNVAMGLKIGAVVNRFEHNYTMIAMARRAVQWTFEYHGSASGSILADERLAGLAPYYGAELCTTVETIYSLSYLYQALGDESFAERAELAAFNALPAAVLGDWWSHQYVTQANQPYSKQLNDPTPFWNVNNRGQMFGLEPDYPCCTINHIQGYPKFLTNSWIAVGNDGLGHALLSPSAVDITLKSGAQIMVEVQTQYPFADSLEYTICTSRPFVFYVRIPSWTKVPSIIVAGKVLEYSPHNLDSRTGMYPIPITGNRTQVTVSLSSRSISLIPRANHTVAIMHGPLLYSLDVGYDAKYTAPRDYKLENGRLNGSIPSQSEDWTIINSKPWNIAIYTSTLRARSQHGDHNANIKALPRQIWSPGAPPVYLEGVGCEIHWPLYRGIPAEAPKNRTCIGEKHTVRLWPVGSSKIGMVELPTLP